MAVPYSLLTLEHLYNEIQSELAGLDPVHLEQVAFSVVNRFLEKSNVWRLTVSPVIANGIAHLHPPDCAVIVYYRDIKWTGDSTKTPRRMTATAPYDITLEPAPEDSLGGDLEAVIILKMLAGSTPSIPDYVHDVHYEALRVGILGRLMMESSKPYTDKQMGIAYTRQCTTATSEARDIAQRMYGRNESIWQYPKWA